MHSIAELIAHAKRNPDQLLFGSAGSGGTMHLSIELFKLMTGTRMVHVPFKGMPQVITEIVGGRLQLMSDNVTSVLPHVTAGRLRALGVTGAKRIPLAPEIPTVAEAGVPGYTMASWFGLLAPAKTPNAIVERLSAETRTAVGNPVFKDRMKSVGLDVDGGTPAAMLATMRSDTQRWAELIKATGIAIPQ